MTRIAKTTAATPVMTSIAESSRLKRQRISCKFFKWREIHIQPQKILPIFSTKFWPKKALASSSTTGCCDQHHIRPHAMHRPARLSTVFWISGRLFSYDQSSCKISKNASTSCWGQNKVGKPTSSGTRELCEVPFLPETTKL